MIDSAIRPLAPVVAPMATPTTTVPTPHATAAAHPFAEVLRQNREAAARPAAPAPAPAPAAPAPTPAPSHGSPPGENASSESTTAETTTSKPKDAGTTRPRGADAADETDSATPTDSNAANEPGTAGSRAKDGGSKEGAPGATDPNPIASALVGARPDAAKPDIASDFNRGREDAAADADRARSSSGAAAGTTAASPFDVATSRAAGSTSAAERRFDLGTTDDRATAASPDTSFAAVLADTKSTHDSATGGDRHGGENLPSTASMAALAGTSGGTGAASGAAASTTSTLPTPVHSPEFAAAFGVQVSVLAKDGVQRAELHLNPADMGPVSIQITLDGTQARVDFGADVAATRHLIEAGLPELASALRDAGFTLAGGGVAEHSTPQGGRGDDADPARGGAARSASSPAIAGEAVTSRMTRQVSAGGVDLYA